VSDSKAGKKIIKALEEAIKAAEQTRHVSPAVMDQLISHLDDHNCSTCRALYRKIMYG